MGYSISAYIGVFKGAKWIIWPHTCQRHPFPVHYKLQIRDAVKNKYTALTLPIFVFSKIRPNAGAYSAAPRPPTWISWVGHGRKESGGGRIGIAMLLRKGKDGRGGVV